MLLAAAAAAALLQTTPGTPPQDQPGRTAETPVCRTEAISGSRIGRFRVCMTPTNWALRSLDAQQFIYRFQTRSVTGR